MARVIVFSEATTPNRILEYLLSVHTPDYQNRTDVVIEPDVTQVAGLPIIYWKHEAGQILPMTQAEQNVINAEIAAAAIALMRTGGKGVLSSQDGFGILQRAFADITKDEINLLRQWIVALKAQTALATNLANFQTRVAALPDMPDRTLAQLKTAIENRIDSGGVDA